MNPVLAPDDANVPPCVRMRQWTSLGVMARLRPSSMERRATRMATDDRTELANHLDRCRDLLGMIRDPAASEDRRGVDRLPWSQTCGNGRARSAAELLTIDPPCLRRGGRRGRWRINRVTALDHRHGCRWQGGTSAGRGSRQAARADGRAFHWAWPPRQESPWADHSRS
jgi:hypothetical protein